MIISHKHKFIFIHQARTGGRSLSVELAEYCGPTDIITPTGDHQGRNHKGWRRHVPACVVRDRLGPRIFEDYFVFTVDRNPWDRVLSSYWACAGYRHGAGGKTEQITWADRLWRKLSGYPWSFDGWLRYRIFRSRMPGFRRRVLPNAISNFADENGRLVVDAVFRYEHLHEQLDIISDRLGLKLTWQANEGRATRQDRRDYTQIYSDWSASCINNYYAETIKLMNYGFGRVAPADVVGYRTDEAHCSLAA